MRPKRALNALRKVGDGRNGGTACGEKVTGTGETGGEEGVRHRFAGRGLEAHLNRAARTRAEEARHVCGRDAFVGVQADVVERTAHLRVRAAAGGGPADESDGGDDEGVVRVGVAAHEPGEQGGGGEAELVKVGPDGGQGGFAAFADLRVVVDADDREVFRDGKARAFGRDEGFGREGVRRGA